MRTIADRIKGITIEIGAETTGLSKALSDVNKESSKLQSELRDVDRLLKFSPDSTELLAQKQKLLADQVETTREKLNRLKDAQEQVNEQFKKGDISEQQYRAFQREIVETESKLKHFESQLTSTKSRLEEFAEKAKVAGDKMKDAGGEMKDVGGGMSKYVTAPIVAGAAGLVGLAAASGQAADRLLDLKEITGMSTDTLQEWQHVATVAGVKSETMSDAVEGLVKKIPQLESEGGNATKAIEKLGLSYNDLKKKSPDDQVDALMNSLSKMEDPLERNAIGSQLFGGAWKDIAPILSLGADGMSEARKEAHELGRVISEDSLNDANDFRIEMDKLTGTMKSAALQIGADLAPLLRDTLGPLIKETIIPALQGFAEKLKAVLEWFKNLSPETQKTIMVVTGLVVAIGPLLVIIGTLVSSVGTIITAFGAASAAITAAGGVIAVLTGPIGIAIAAIAALIAIGVLLYKNWDTIKAKAIDIWNSISEFFSSFWNSTKELFNNALNWIDEATGGKFKSITDMIRSYIEMADNIIKTIINSIKETFKNSLDFLKALVTGDFEGMKNAISNQMENVKSTIKNIWNEIMTFFKNINLYDIGRDIIQGLIDGIKSMVKAAANAVKSVAGSVVNATKSAMGINSPSKVMRDEIGKWIPVGLADGIEANLDAVKKASSQMSKVAIPNIDKSALNVPSSTTVASGPNINIINQGTIVGRNGMEEFADTVGKTLSRKYGLSTGGAY